jgi:HemK-like putative methylase
VNSIDQGKRWLLHEKHNGVESAAFRADCARLNAGEPLGYVIGHVPFLNCKIFLQAETSIGDVAKPLIPRVETEYWVEIAIGLIQKQIEGVHLQRPQRAYSERGQAEKERLLSANTPQVLDLCAGSGCIGVAVAEHVAEARVDFAEIDPRLLSTIQKNIDANVEESERCRVFESDLFANLPSDTTYDFILTNPPYIDPAVDRAEQSVKTYEPHLALYGGRGGVELINSIIAAAPHHLTLRGQLWIEHEPEQAAAITALGSEHGFAVTNERDQYGRTRYSVLIQG